MSKKPSTIRIGRRYRANRLSLPYDVLVIGSGIGGLTAIQLGGFKGFGLARKIFL